MTGDPRSDVRILAEDAEQFEDAIEDLRQVEVPEDMAAAHGIFVGTAEESLRLIKEAHRTAAAARGRAYRSALPLWEAHSVSVVAVANRLGVEDCAG